jgi:hypothetical protein
MASRDNLPKKSILKTSIPSTQVGSLAAVLPSPPTSPPKQQTSGTASSTQSYQYRGDRNPDPRHLAIALHHAHQIQAQKDAEALILNRILDLVALPSSPSADPAAPSAADADALKSALLLFQPSDYDNLVLERNIEGLCGYALCPREHRKEDPKAKFRILWGPKGSGHGGRGREMKVVPRDKLEMWCSDECAERAMYVRVQLAEEPVWERRVEDGAAKQILLLEEASTRKREKSNGRNKETLREASGSNMPPSADDVMVDGLKKLSVNYRPHRSSQGSKELALERGDSNAAFRQRGRVDVQIMEKGSTGSASDGDRAGIPAAPVLRPESQTGGSIEGYIPKNNRLQSDTADREDDSSDEEDSDQDILDQI